MSNWHFRAKAAAAKQMIGDIKPWAIWDIGAGGGEFSAYMVRAGIVPGALCIDTAYSERPFSRGALYFSRPEKVETRPNGMTLVMMLDVLEHVEDDLGFLREYRPLPGGYMLVSAPAFMRLWSDHDEACGHYRRYRLQDLEHLLGLAGMEVLRGRYLFTGPLLLAPLARWQRAGPSVDRGGAKHLPWLLDRLAGAACAVERRLVFPWNRTAGLTAMVLARRG